MKILMRNVGMTLHVIHTLRAQGIDNVKVNMDWQHLLMNDESLAEYAALLAAEGLLGHQHANSGWGTFDDDNMVGATAFMETLELAVELRRAGYGDDGERLGFDLYPYTEDAIEAVRRSVLQWRFIDSRRGEDRRRRAARGADAQGRRARLRARVRGARRVTAALVGLDVGTTGVKAIAIAPDGEVVASRRGGLSALDAAARLVGAGSRGLVARERGGARRARPSATSPAIGLSGQMHGLVCLDDRGSRAPARDPVERPAHGGRVRRDRGARRARAADRADRQPRAAGLHRAEAALAAPPRARRLRADPRGCCYRRTTCACV